MIELGAQSRRIGRHIVWCAGVIVWVMCALQARAATAHWRALAQETQHCARHLVDRRELQRIDPEEMGNSLNALLPNGVVFWEKCPSRYGQVRYRLAGDTALRWDQVITLVRALSAPCSRSHFFFIHTLSINPAQRDDLCHIALVVTGAAP